MTEDQRNLQSIPEALADEPTRQKLAKARKRTRASLARKLKVSMDTIRRSEKRIDLYLAILRPVVERKRGTVRLEATFPDQPPVILAGLGENTAKERGKNRAKKKARAAAKSKPAPRRAA